MKYTFEKIIGYDDIKQELDQYCDIIKNPETYARMGVTIPHGLLLYGVPGVGKSTLAESFIKASGNMPVL